MVMERRMGQARRGFTLIELLVVILIIAVLVGIGLAVGSRVVEGGKTTQTRDVLKTLDAVLTSYRQSTDGLPPAAILDPRQDEGNPTGTIVYMPMADGVDGDGAPINSVGLFLAEAKRVPEVGKILENLDARLYREFAYTDAAALVSTPDESEALLSTVFDAWGNPIRFVHPAFHGVVRDTVTLSDPKWLGPAPGGASYFPRQMRRDPSRGDADGGLTTGQPYFYSAGPDGDPSTIEDNVYLVEPKFQR